MGLFELAVEGAHLTRQSEDKLVADPLDRVPGVSAPRSASVSEALSCLAARSAVGSAHGAWWLACSFLSANADECWMPVWYVVAKWG